LDTRIFEYVIMRVSLHAGVGRFLAAAECFMREDPFSSNVIAVIAGRIAAGTQPDIDNYLWATMDNGDGRVIGVAMQTPPHALFVSRMPAEAAATLAGALADTGRDLPGVNGAVSSAAAFAQAWNARTGHASKVVTTMRMYRLGELVRPTDVPGTAALAAAPRDIGLVAEWFAAFHDEARPHAPAEDWRVSAERRIGPGQVHLWRDGGASVALAAVSAPAAGVARVGPVYTPPGLRRRGYGAAVTAEATAAAMTGGAEHLVLYTDLANPTSNSIYQAIGYRPDHDAEERSFQ
jgi:predicted GNAT family acetyltransferase